MSVSENVVLVSTIKYIYNSSILHIFTVSWNSFFLLFWNNTALYNPILGNILGVVSALGFSVYAVALTVIPTQHKEDGMYGVVMSMWGAITVVIGAMLVRNFSLICPIVFLLLTDL